VGDQIGEEERQSFIASGQQALTFLLLHKIIEVSSG
jgi:hypothetical protein